MPSKKNNQLLEVFSEDEAQIIDTIINKPHILGNLAGKTKLTELHSEWIKYIWDTEKMRSLQAHRGSYKSTAVGAVGTVRHLLQHPDDRIAIVRKTFTDAADTVSTIAKIMADPLIREIFRMVHREYPEFTVRRKEKIEFTFKKTKTNEGSVEAFGLDAAFTGRHFDRMLLDDVVTLKDRQSRAERERTKDTIREIQTNIIDPGKPVSFIGTPWHSEDAWQICPRPKKYSINDCDILSDEELAEKRKLTTPSLFAANYLLEHVPDEGALFANPQWGPWQDKGIEKVYAHIDAAFDGDHYCALTMMARRYDGKIQAIGFTYPGNIKDWAPDAMDLMRRYKARKLYIETNPDKGYTADLFRTLRMIVEDYDENMNKHTKIASYLYECWPNIIWDSETDGDYMSQIQDYMEGQTPDDACLVGDTIVLTDKGAKYIKDITEGELVLTPFGFKKVLFSRCTGVSKVITKEGITGTADHKVFDTNRNGFFPLIEDNIVSKFSIKEMFQWERARRLNSMGIDTNAEGRASIISAYSLVKNGKVHNSFIEQFGNFIAEKRYLKAFTFIIKTLTPIIMILRIWSAWKLKSIYRCMQNLISVLKKPKREITRIFLRYEKKHLLGIVAQRVLHGIENMLKNLFLKIGLLEKKESVNSVMRNMKPIIYTNDFVQPNVGIGNERVSVKNMILSVSSVKGHFNLLSLTQNIVHTHAKKDIIAKGKEVPVYNLTVEDVGCFYANGILVSNCDSAASLCRAKFSSRGSARANRYEW